MDVVVRWSGRISDYAASSRLFREGLSRSLPVGSIIHRDMVVERGGFVYALLRLPNRSSLSECRVRPFRSIPFGFVYSFVTRLVFTCDEDGC
jgi:hypothetical protein